MTNTCFLPLQDKIAGSFPAHKQKINSRQHRFLEEDPPTQYLTCRMLAFPLCKTTPCLWQGPHSNLGEPCLESRYVPYCTMEKDNHTAQSKSQRLHTKGCSKAWARARAQLSTCLSHSTGIWVQCQFGVKQRLSVMIKAHWLFLLSFTWNTQDVFILTSLWMISCRWHGKDPTFLEPKPKTALIWYSH